MKNIDASLDVLRVTICITALLLIPSSVQITQSILSSSDLWQGLGGSLIGAMVTCATIVVMLHQIRTDNLRHNENRRKKFLALRVRMPESLNDLAEYANSYFDHLHNEEIPLPERPTSALDVFKNAIEFIDDANYQAIYEMVSFFQIHEARLKGYISRAQDKTPSIDNYEFRQAIKDLVHLNFLILQMFEYARGEVEKIPTNTPSDDDYIRSLHALDRYNYRRSVKLQDIFSL